MKLHLWTYEGPPHVGAMRVATGMKGLHYVLHAPQGDTYADLLFTMIERRNHRPPVTYTTFQARDLGGDTAELFKTAAQDAYERFQPEAMIVGASCTAELIQDDPGGLAKALAPALPTIPLELPSLPEEGELGAPPKPSYQIVRGLADSCDGGIGRFAPATCNIRRDLPSGFRPPADISEGDPRLLAVPRVSTVNASPHGGAAARTSRAILRGRLQRRPCGPETAAVAARWAREDLCPAFTEGPSPYRRRAPRAPSIEECGGARGRRPRARARGFRTAG